MSSLLKKGETSRRRLSPPQLAPTRLSALFPHNRRFIALLLSHDVMKLPGEHGDASWRRQGRGRRLARQGRRAIPLSSEGQALPARVRRAVSSRTPRGYTHRDRPLRREG